MIFYCVVITVLPPGSKNLTLFLFLCFVEDDILNIYFVMHMCAYTLVCVYERETRTTLFLFVKCVFLNLNL